MDREKRQLRKLKRDIKRAGSKRRRQHLKRELVENPEEAIRYLKGDGQYSDRERFPIPHFVLLDHEMPGDGR